MKKYLLIVAIFMGLQSQAQFFNGPCDSIGISVNPSSTATTLLLDGIVGNINGSTIAWDWDIVDNMGNNQLFTTQNITLNNVSAND